MNRDEIIEVLESVFATTLNNKNELEQLFSKAKHENGWFIADNLDFCLSEWYNILNKSSLNDFISAHSFAQNSKKIGLIMAGNIPMVGFHDLLCVLLSGHTAIIKLSSDDKVLIPYFVNKMIEANQAIEERVEFVDRIKDVDAVIATGSNNTSRYFESYFGHLPNIIRKNRTSVGIISGNESEDELMALGSDIYRYFGLGCRNVSCLLIPKDYNLSTFLTAIEPFVTLMDHHKYANNYTYHKAIWLMDNEVHYDNGFMCFKEERNIHAPLSTLYYWRYENEEDIEQFLKEFESDIQCVSGLNKRFCDANPGETQSPKLTDYADKINVMDFLESLS